MERGFDSVIERRRQLAGQEKDWLVHHIIELEVSTAKRPSRPSIPLPTSDGNLYLLHAGFTSPESFAVLCLLDCRSSFLGCL